MGTTIETIKTPERVTVSFPTDELQPDEIDRIVSLLKVAVIARKSKMTVDEAEAISEEIKASWWEKNKDRILKMIEQNG
jgi:hypothetical protein